MIFLSVLLFVVFNQSYAFDTIKPKDIPLRVAELAAKEKHVQYLQETDVCEPNLPQLEEDAGDLRFQILYSLKERSECLSTLRCGGVGYVPGCNCWTYVRQRVNGTTVFSFNQFHLLGAETVPVQEDEDLLQSCDNATHPDDLRDIRLNSDIKGFTHCVKDGRLECFCSTRIEEHNIEGKCSDRSLAKGAYCEDYVFVDKSVDENNADHYRFEEKKVYKCEDTGIVKTLKEFCKNEEFLANYRLMFEEVGQLGYFEHCIQEGKISCFCGASYSKGVLNVLGCGSDMALVGYMCVRKVEP